MELSSKLKKVEITDNDGSADFVTVKLTVEGTAAHIKEQAGKE